MFPYDLVKNENAGNIVENEPGLGLGVKIHNQVYKSLGLLIDFSFTDLEVTDSSLSTATIFTGGGYFSRATAIGDFTFNLGYGIISVADYARSLFMPGLEYSRQISERTTISAGFDWVIPNDWFYNYSIETNYKSFSFFLVCGIVF